MYRIRNFVYFAGFAILLLSACTVQTPDTPLAGTPGTGNTSKSPIPSTTLKGADATATPEPLPVADPAVQAAMQACATIQIGQVCLGEGPVQVTAQPERSLLAFRKPGQMLNLADIQSLKLGEAGSTKGLLVLRIPTEWPGGAFTALAIGDVELVNEVPYGTREFNPMQSLKLTTGPNEEGKQPANGFFVASPDDGSLSTLVVNGVELSFGSGGWLTGPDGGLTIETAWGSVGAWFQDRIVQIKRGFGLHLTHEEILRELAKEPYVDPAFRTVGEVLKKYFDKKPPYDPASETVMRALEKYFGCKDWQTNSGCGNKDDPTTDKKYRALEEQRKRQKAWKGGWWKMTYGLVSTSGECKMEVVGDGGTGDGEPYTTEVPICRGNNGNTILMYDSGLSYDRIAPNLYTKSYISEYDFLGNSNYVLEGEFQTLQVVSPTRMILSKSSAEKDGCTTSSTIILDFIRDDPNIRCGKIIYVDPYKKPTPPTPTPAPKNVEPPLEGQYKAHISTVVKGCDAKAKAFAPSFTSASLNLSPENKLTLDAAVKKYELALSPLTYEYSSQKTNVDEERLGIFLLEQPEAESFSLTLSLMQIPGQQWTGNWLVANADASQLCSGSIDLFPPEK